MSAPVVIKASGNNYNPASDGLYFLRGWSGDKPIYKKTTHHERWIWWDGSGYICGTLDGIYGGGGFASSKNLLGQWNEHIVTDEGAGSAQANTAAPLSEFITMQDTDANPACDGTYKLVDVHAGKPVYCKESGHERWIWWNSDCGVYICGTKDGIHGRGGFCSSGNLFGKWNSGKCTPA